MIRSSTRTHPLAVLLSSHLFMAGLMISAFGLPLVLAGGFDGRALQPLGAATALAACVQTFWLVGSYLLLSQRWTWSERAYAAIVVAAMLGLAIAFALGTGAIPIDRVLVPDTVAQSLAPLMPLGVALYFVTMAMTAARISNNAGQAVGYFFLMFYWPFTLSFFARRLRVAFEHAAEKRAEAHLTR